MNTSGFVLDSLNWLSWAADAVYVACFFLGLYTIALVVCYAIVAAKGDSVAPTKEMPVAH
jgi:hypothetical protein